MTLQGKVALVTGSTSGIGFGVAQALAQAGASIMLSGFGDPASIEAMRAELAQACGVAVGYHNVDLAKAAGVAELVAEAERTLGSVDVLVNNAGIQFVASIEDFPDDRWDAVIAVNLSAVFHGMKAAIPGMKRRG